MLSAEELSLLAQVGFPSVQPCVNYLSGGIDGVRGYEPRADWQHSKFLQELFKMYYLVLILCTSKIRFRLPVAFNILFDCHIYLRANLDLSNPCVFSICAFTFLSTYLCFVCSYLPVSQAVLDL